MKNTTISLYGFKSANTYEEPAWFHSPEAALRFANACRFTIRTEGNSAADDTERAYTAADLDIRDTDEVDSKWIMDTPETAWVDK